MAYAFPNNFFNTYTRVRAKVGVMNIYGILSITIIMTINRSQLHLHVLVSKSVTLCSKTIPKNHQSN